jgi:mannonate dehydratase
VYLGTQVGARDDDDYRVFAQLGIKHICADPARVARQLDAGGSRAHREKVESFGLTLDMIQLPLPSQAIEKASYPDILLAGPDRDRQIDAVCKLIEDCAAAGIPAAKYNLNLIGIPRTPMSRAAAAR